MGNERTGPGAVARARAFYESVGKVTIEVKREVPGHGANRLQAALWREAIHLVNEGVATVEDIDTAVWSGPSLLFHLGAGEGGLAACCERYSDSFHRWWADLGEPHLDQITSARLVDGLRPITDTHSVDDLATRRDALLATIVAATHRHAARQGSGRATLDR
jgi:carnitine 3-dehydrogenase